MSFVHIFVTNQSGDNTSKDMKEASTEIFEKLLEDIS